MILIGRKLISTTILALGVFFAGLPSVALAQSNTELVNRLSRLEREISDLQRHIFGNDGKTRPSITSTPVSVGAGEEETAGTAARTEIRLQQLETQLRNLTGKVENVDFKLDQLNSRVDSLVSDLDKRLAAIEGRPAEPGMAVSKNLQSNNDSASGTASESEPGDHEKAIKPGVLGYLSQNDLRRIEADKIGKTQSTVVDASESNSSRVKPEARQVNSAPGTVLPEGAPSERYKHAWNYLMRHDYELAERAFREFTKAHGDDPLAGNAMYWLGETHYVRGQFAEAAVTFAEGYEKYPGSPKTVDNLLKLGFSLARLNRIEDACVALAQLRDEFPNASATIKRRTMSEGERIGCKG